MKRFITVLILAALALGLIATGAAAGPGRACAPTPDTIATFSPGQYGAFAEGMAADSHGRLLVSMTTWGYYDESDETNAESNIGEVWRVTPSGDKRLIATMDLGPWGMFVGVAVDRLDRAYVGVSDFGDPQVVGNSVFRVAPDGVMTRVMTLPAGIWPNGLAHRDGHLYVTDSSSGAVWRARLDGGVSSPATPWVQDELLGPGDPATDPTAWGLGANGIAFYRDELFVSVSDAGRVVRIPVKKDGSPGRPQTVCERAKLKSADGLAFDALGGLWIVTNAGSTGASPSGAVYRLSPATGLRLVADDPGWLNYPTMPVFGTTPRTRCTLFVQNGAFYDYEDDTAPDIQAVRVGVPGLPQR